MPIHPALASAILTRPRDEVVLFRLAANESYIDALNGGVVRLIRWDEESREFGVTIGDLQVLLGLPPTTTPPPPVTTLYKVTPPNNLNVRAAPGVTSEKVGSLKSGSLVWIGETQNGWGRIHSGTFAGKWINMQYVSKT